MVDRCGTRVFLIALTRILIVVTSQYIVQRHKRLHFQSNLMAGIDDTRTEIGSGILKLGKLTARFVPSRPLFRTSND